MNEILEIVGKGISVLVGLVGVWAGANTDEEKAAILSKAKELVAGLDAYFAERDALDAAKMAQLQAAIDAEKNKEPE